MKARAIYIADGVHSELADYLEAVAAVMRKHYSGSRELDATRATGMLANLLRNARLVDLPPDLAGAVPPYQNATPVAKPGEIAPGVKVFAGGHSPRRAWECGYAIRNNPRMGSWLVRYQDGGEDWIYTKDLCIAD